MKRVTRFHFILLCFCFGCSFFNNEITQYIVLKNGAKLQPVAKVVYKVFVDRQEVVYWVEVPGERRSQLYKLRGCIVVDKNNWEGEPEYYSSVPWTTRVEFVNGKFINSDNASWWTWHFKTDPKPSNLALIVGSVMGILMIIGIIMGVYDKVQKWREKKRKEVQK